MFASLCRSCMHASGDSSNFSARLVCYCVPFFQYILRTSFAECWNVSVSCNKLISVQSTLLVVFSKCADFRKEHHSEIGSPAAAEILNSQEAWLRRLFCNAIMVFSVYIVQLSVVAEGDVMAMRQIHVMKGWQRKNLLLTTWLSIMALANAYSFVVTSSVPCWLCKVIIPSKMLPLHFSLRFPTRIKMPDAQVAAIQFVVINHFCDPCPAEARSEHGHIIRSSVCATYAS